MAQLRLLRSELNVCGDSTATTGRSVQSTPERFLSAGGVSAGNAAGHRRTGGVVGSECLLPLAVADRRRIRKAPVVGAQIRRHLIASPAIPRTSPIGASGRSLLGIWLAVPLRSKPVMSSPTPYSVGATHSD